MSKKFDVKDKLFSERQNLDKVLIKLKDFVHLIIDRNIVLYWLPWSIVTNIIVSPSSIEELRTERYTTTQIFRVCPHNLQKKYRWDKQTVLSETSSHSTCISDGGALPVYNDHTLHCSCPPISYRKTSL